MSPNYNFDGNLSIQVFSGGWPFKEAKNDYIVIANIMKGKRPQRPSKSLASASGLSASLWDLIQQCWSGTPDIRPHAQDIVNTIKQSRPVWEDSRPTLTWADRAAFFAEHADHPILTSIQMNQPLRQDSGFGEQTSEWWGDEDEDRQGDSAVSASNLSQTIHDQFYGFNYVAPVRNDSGYTEGTVSSSLSIVSMSETEYSEIDDISESDEDQDEVGSGSGESPTESRFSSLSYAEVAPELSEPLELTPIRPPRPSIQHRKNMDTLDELSYPMEPLELTPVQRFGPSPYYGNILEKVDEFATRSPEEHPEFEAIIEPLNRRDTKWPSGSNVLDWYRPASPVKDDKSISNSDNMVEPETSTEISSQCNPPRIAGGTFQQPSPPSSERLSKDDLDRLDDMQYHDGINQPDDSRRKRNFSGLKNHPLLNLAMSTEEKSQSHSISNVYDILHR